MKTKQVTGKIMSTTVKISCIYFNIELSKHHRSFAKPSACSSYLHADITENYPVHHKFNDLCYCR